LTVPTGLASGVSLAAPRFRPGCATCVFRVSGGAAGPPWSGCIAMPSVRAPIPQSAAIRPLGRGPAQTLGEEGSLRRWRRRRSRQREKLHTRAAEVPRGARGAVPLLRGRGGHEACSSRGTSARRFLRLTWRQRRPVRRHALTQCGAVEARGLSHPDGRANRIKSPCRAGHDQRRTPAVTRTAAPDLYRLPRRKADASASASAWNPDSRPLPVAAALTPAPRPGGQPRLAARLPLVSPTAGQVRRLATAVSGVAVT